MKKILLSVFTIALVAVVAIGATRAYFTDTAQITGNTITSGTLDLALGGTVPVIYGNLVPGDTINPYYLELRNTGSMDMLFRVYLNPTLNESGIASKLNAVITINPSEYVYTDGYLPYGPTDTVIWTGTLDQLFGVVNALDNVDAAFVDGWPLNPGYSAVYKMSITFDAEAGNAYQGKSFTGNIVADGTQFDNQPVFEGDGTTLKAVYKSFIQW